MKNDTQQPKVQLNDASDDKMNIMKSDAEDYRILKQLQGALLEEELQSADPKVVESYIANEIGKIKNKDILVSQKENFWQGNQKNSESISLAIDSILKNAETKYENSKVSFEEEATKVLGGTRDKIGDSVAIALDEQKQKLINSPIKEADSIKNSKNLSSEEVKEKINNIKSIENRCEILKTQANDCNIIQQLKIDLSNEPLKSQKSPVIEQYIKNELNKIQQNDLQGIDALRNLTTINTNTNAKNRTEGVLKFVDVAIESAKGRYINSNTSLLGDSYQNTDLIKESRKSAQKILDTKASTSDVSEKIDKIKKLQLVSENAPKVQPSEKVTPKIGANRSKQEPKATDKQNSTDNAKSVDPKQEPKAPKSLEDIAIGYAKDNKIIEQLRNDLSSKSPLMGKSPVIIEEYIKNEISKLTNVYESKSLSSIAIEKTSEGLKKLNEAMTGLTTESNKKTQEAQIAAGAEQSIEFRKQLTENAQVVKRGIQDFSPDIEAKIEAIEKGQVNAMSNSGPSTKNDKGDTQIPDLSSVDVKVDTAALKNNPPQKTSQTAKPLPKIPPQQATQQQSTAPDATATVTVAAATTATPPINKPPAAPSGPSPEVLKAYAGNVAKLGEEVNKKLDSYKPQPTYHPSSSNYNNNKSDLSDISRLIKGQDPKKVKYVNDSYKKLTFSEDETKSLIDAVKVKQGEATQKVNEITSKLNDIANSAATPDVKVIDQHLKDLDNVSLAPVDKAIKRHRALGKQSMDTQVKIMDLKGDVIKIQAGGGTAEDTKKQIASLESEVVKISQKEQELKSSILNYSNAVNENAKLKEEIVNLDKSINSADTTPDKKKGFEDQKIGLQSKIDANKKTIDGFEEAHARKKSVNLQQNKDKLIAQATLDIKKKAEVSQNVSSQQVKPDKVIEVALSSPSISPKISSDNKSSDVEQGKQHIAPQHTNAQKSKDTPAKSPAQAPKMSKYGVLMNALGYGDSDKDKKKGPSIGGPVGFALKVAGGVAKLGAVLTVFAAKRMILPVVKLATKAVQMFGKALGKPFDKCLEKFREPNSNKALWGALMAVTSPFKAVGVVTEISAIVTNQAAKIATNVVAGAAVVGAGAVTLSGNKAKAGLEVMTRGIIEGLSGAAKDIEKAVVSAANLKMEGKDGDKGFVSKQPANDLAKPQPQKQFGDLDKDVQKATTRLSMSIIEAKNGGQLTEQAITKPRAKSSSLA